MILFLEKKEEIILVEVVVMILSMEMNDEIYSRKSR